MSATRPAPNTRSATNAMRSNSPGPMLPMRIFLLQWLRSYVPVPPCHLLAVCHIVGKRAPNHAITTVAPAARSGARRISELPLDGKRSAARSRPRARMGPTAPVRTALTRPRARPRRTTVTAAIAAKLTASARESSRGRRDGGRVAPRGRPVNPQRVDMESYPRAGVREGQVGVRQLEVAEIAGRARVARREDDGRERAWSLAHEPRCHAAVAEPRRPEEGHRVRSRRVGPRAGGFALGDQLADDAARLRRLAGGCPRDRPQREGEAEALAAEARDRPEGPLPEQAHDPGLAPLDEGQRSQGPPDRPSDGQGRLHGDHREAPRERAGDTPRHRRVEQPGDDADEAGRESEREGDRRRQEGAAEGRSGPDRAHYCWIPVPVNVVVAFRHLP